MKSLFEEMGGTYTLGADGRRRNGTSPNGVFKNYVKKAE